MSSVNSKVSATPVAIQEQSPAEMVLECEKMSLSLPLQIELLRRMATYAKGQGNVIEFFKTEVARFDVQKKKPLTWRAKLLDGSPEGEKFVRASYRLLTEGNKDIGEMVEYFPKIFLPGTRTIVKLGWHSGELDTVLREQVNFLSRLQTNRQKLKQMMYEPAALGITLVIVMCILLGFVFPRLKDVFYILTEGTSTDMGIWTESLLWISSIFERFWWAFLVSVPSIMLAFWQIYQKSDSFKKKVDKLILAIPIVGRIITRLDTANFLRALATMFNAGGVENRAALLRMACESFSNSSLKEGAVKGSLAFANSEPDTIHLAFSYADDAFGPTTSFYRVMQTFEEQGNANILLEQAVTLEERAEDDRALLNAMLPKVILVISAFMVFWILMALYNPLLIIITKLSAPHA